jgi:hypothetical protein
LPDLPKKIKKEFFFQICRLLQFKIKNLLNTKMLRIHCPISTWSEEIFTVSFERLLLLKMFNVTKYEVFSFFVGFQQMRAF